MRRSLKLLILTVGLAVVSAPAFATMDIAGILALMLINMDAKGEASNNESAKKDLVKINKIFGDPEAVSVEIVDVGASVPFDKYAPTVSDDVQNILDQGGYASIPELREYIKQNMTLLNAVDFEKQTDVLLKTKERLNLSSLAAIQKAKNVLVLSNKAPEEADRQLELSGKQTDLHHRFAQESAQDLQLMKRDISLNQLMAQLLETTSMGAITDLQNSTLDEPEQLQDVGISAANPD